MKLAVALQERADLNRRISSLNTRLASNCLVQEGDSPAEDPNELLRELDDCVSRLTELMARINRTNCETRLDGRSITDLIAEKDGLKVQLAAYQSVIYEASQAARRATHSEIRIISAVSVRDLQKKADEISKCIRLLDNALQACN